MTLLLLALLAAIATATGIVLADSGLRLMSALGGIRAEQAMVAGGADIPSLRGQRANRVTTRVSYARAAVAAGSVPRRAAA